MTIETQGHVESMVVTTGDRVKVKLSIAMHRIQEPIWIEMSREEAKHYMPGTGFVLQIRPQGDVGKPL